jgi:peptide/nickel transport system permease protein
MTATASSGGVLDLSASAHRRSRLRVRAPLLLAVCMAIGLLFVTLGVGAQWVAPHDPNHLDLVHRLRPPAWQAKGTSKNVLGTDQLGRDTLSRLMYGARISLLVVVISIPIALVLGSTLGLAAGWFGGWTSRILMALVDTQLALPGILLAVMLASIFKPSFRNVVVVLVVFLWAGFARLVRGETVSVVQREFIVAARASGASSTRIMLSHILPNVTNPIIILATLNVASVILAEASLSFLGVGVAQTSISWGLMIADGRSLLSTAWWLVAAPGVAIVLVALVGNLFGDWLRDALDPRLRNVR